MPAARPLAVLLALVAFLPGCAAAPVAKDSGSPELFTFHDGFWLNLHQLLLAEGRPRRRPVPGPTRDDPRWVEAIELYRKDLSQRFFLDDELARINLQLSREDGATLSAGVDPALKAILERVAPAFREREWPEDQRRSQQWVEQARVLLGRAGPALAEEVARVFGTPWPKEPVRVETSKQAGPFGAFSLGTPLMITISTADPGYQGPASLEMLFHEASHGLDGPLVRALERECARQSVPVPESLDHALLFFTVGELARRHLGPEYQPYAYKNGIYQRGWTGYEAALRSEWLPHLEGRVGREAALAALVAKASKPLP